MTEIDLAGAHVTVECPDPMCEDGRKYLGVGNVHICELCDGDGVLKDMVVVSGTIDHR